ncbi:MAG: glutamate racemase [Treponema sp.]|nr:glutamate racemase [Treponema sp.]
MTNRPVLFLDSGIGGIPYCRNYLNRNPNESIVYLADRLHFPYGIREKNELIDILSTLVDLLIKTINPKIIVLACNTATLAALAVLREHFPKIAFVGTVPAIKPAALASKNGKIGVLGTELTIKQPFVKELAAQYGSNDITGIAAPELVTFIEKSFYSASDDEKKAFVQNYLNKFRAAGIDTLVLGCTHFLFLLDVFQREASPDITVFDSIRGITRRIESLLTDTVIPQGNNSYPKNRLLLTGSSEPESTWESWADQLGFSLSLLNSEQ